MNKLILLILCWLMLGGPLWAESPQDANQSSAKPAATVTTDNAEAASLRVKAEDGDVTSASKLGLLYLTGQGVPKDLKEALKWLRMAANQGNTYAQTSIGWMYDNGQGVAHDYSQALGWYQKAADLGDTTALYNLGVMYENGRGAAKNTTTAVEWYKKSAAQGDADAQAALKRLDASGSTSIASQTAPEPVASTPQAQTTTTSTTDEKTDNSITPDQAKQWLKEKIEAFGGDTFSDDARDLKATITYQDVSFDGDTLSLRVSIVNNNGHSSTVEKINIAAIRKGSFKYSSDDRSRDKGTTYNPVVVYKIQWSASGTESPISTDNDATFYTIKIKDEAIAKRIVNALNFLSTQTKAHPSHKADNRAAPH